MAVNVGDWYKTLPPAWLHQVSYNFVVNIITQTNMTRVRLTVAMILQFYTMLGNQQMYAEPN